MYVSKRGLYLRLYLYYCIRERKAGSCRQLYSFFNNTNLISKMIIQQDATTRGNWVKGYMRVSLKQAL
jgi:hypothetical protein